jgi:hypothetical protein
MERSRIGCVLGATEVEVTVRGQDPTVPSQPGRPDTVEEVTTASHGVEHTFGIAQTHHIPDLRSTTERRLQPSCEGTRAA